MANQCISEPLNEKNAAMLNAIRRIAGSRSLDVLFYASSWIDELWVRSTIAACRKNRLRVALALGSENLLPEDAIRLYKNSGVPVAAAQGTEHLRKRRARLVVTATSGVLRDWFHPTVKHLIHMPHSLSSLHMIYPEDCFDGYDMLFASGPHHVREFDALSTARRIPGRRSFPIGYGKLDLLRDTAASHPPLSGNQAGRHVLLAPSWGPGNILHTMGLELVGLLLKEGYAVTLRPHPSFFLDREPIVDAIASAYGDERGFFLEHATGLGEAMFTADTLISDYSGSALEFAALRGKPVVFIDVPKKVVNPGWESLGIGPVELGMRARLGKLVPASANAVREALAEEVSFADDARTIAAFCYCERQCGETAAEKIIELLEE